MKFKIKKNNYCSIPKYHLLDDNLSLSAKGLMSWFLLNEWTGTYEALIKSTITEEGEIEKVIDELIVKGYLQITDTGITVLEKANKKLEQKPLFTKILVYPDVTSPFVSSDISNQVSLSDISHTNLFQKCSNEIRKYTDDEELRNALYKYLKERLSPKHPKLKDKKIKSVNEWKWVLRTLEAMEGDKAYIVRRSTEKGWGKFVDVISRDGVRSKSYSEKELEEMRNRIEKLGGTLNATK